MATYANCPKCDGKIEIKLNCELDAVCEHCGASYCPWCGADDKHMTVHSEDEEVDQYCGPGCAICGWEHCGRCV
jgi:hypothetical protein